VSQSPAEIAELLAGLERDAAELSDELGRLAAASEKAEADAIAAVQAGNDAVARDCLARQDRLSDSAAVMERQLAMQQAFIATCRELLASVTPQTSEPEASEESDDEEGEDPDSYALMDKVAEIQRQLSAVLPPPPPPPGDKT
jgi:phage shock protein A